MALVVDTNTRYHRQELITWWDQSRLLASRVLVVGAGALGNEVVKNLALVGIGHIDVVDMDTVEHSNLARCVFFREESEGRPKAEALVDAASAVNADVELQAYVAPVQRLGIATLAEYDLVIGALDNREARAWVSQAVRKLGSHWIDGAIEGLRGLARMFGPDGPCYACTLSEADWVQMSHRKSCTLLAPEEIREGKTPTNATTAAIIAGVEVQEAIKFLSGARDRLSLVGGCWTYTGDSMESYVVRYREDEWCQDHDRYNDIQPSNAVSAAELVAISPGCIAIDFEEDVITLGSCPSCGGEPRTQVRSALHEGAGRCPSCSAEFPAELATSFVPDDPRLHLSFVELGLSMKDIVTVRCADRRFHYQVNGAL